MKLLIKQKVFALTSTYDVYDEDGNPKYYVKHEAFSVPCTVHVKDRNGKEIGRITQEWMSLLPMYHIEIGGIPYGSIERKFSLIHPKYDLDYNGWRCEGDFLTWNYDVYEGCSCVAHISKELFRWGDTYAIDIADPEDEIVAMMLVIAIDMANSAQKKHT